MASESQSDVTKSELGANPGYAQFQIARALLTAEQHADPATRQRAERKVARWVQVVEGMADGSLTVGMRTPVANTPAWVTLEVVTGGFATGSFLAAGSLQPHEIQLLEELGLSADRADDARRTLNHFFLTESGLQRLQEMLRSGCFAVNVPEEGALLIVAWLVQHGHVDQARNLLEEIGPWFDRLRFYPVPTATPRIAGTRVFLRNIRQVSQALTQIRPHAGVLAQREALQVWAPRYEQLVALFLETVVGPQPALDPAKSPQAAVGGWPCQQYPEGWFARLKVWLADFDRMLAVHDLTSKGTRPKEHFAQLIQFARQLFAPPLLTGKEVGRVRLILACYLTKHGVPESAESLARQARQARDVEQPLHAEIARVVQARLELLPPDEGVNDLDDVTSPVTCSEQRKFAVAEGTAVPPSLERKVSFARCDTIDRLVTAKVITSAEVVGQLLPQITAAQTTGLADESLSRAHSAVYRAFRQRRSLLLLNLESQVRLEELPWIAAIKQFHRKGTAQQIAARRVLEEVCALTIPAFPQTILPNKLLPELRTLAERAGLKLPLVDELAADIFMGQFAGKFVEAAQQAATLLTGSLYARYYDLDFTRVLQLPRPEKKPQPRWFGGAQPADALASLCAERAGVQLGTWQPATNGMIIEQEQILTTHNLATLFIALDLTTTLRDQLYAMAEQCFRWVIRRLQMKTSTRHARLIAVKNSAYAWRQMIFYLSLLSDDQVDAFDQFAIQHFDQQPEKFRDLFDTVFTGLLMATSGTPLTPDTFDGLAAVRFLGWSNDSHWLVKGMEAL